MKRITHTIAALLIAPVTASLVHAAEVEEVYLLAQKTNIQVALDCASKPDKKMQAGIPGILLRKTTCNEKPYVEMLFNGEKVVAPRTDIFVLDEDGLKAVDNFNEQDAQASLEDWKAFSKKLYATNLANAQKAIRAVYAAGVLIKNMTVFDQSEYTDATGWRTSIVNLNKKTIKYVTFRIVGINAVGDPVREMGQTVRTLRGVGPIEHGEEATYKDEFMWMTDIVESSRLASVTIEYMDGSKKTISDTASIEPRISISTAILGDIGLEP